MLGGFFPILVLGSTVCNFFFTILRPFGTKESIRRKVDHGGQIVLWYWQHATNLARAKQKRSLIFCVFG